MPRGVVGDVHPIRRVTLVRGFAIQEPVKRSIPILIVTATLFASALTHGGDTAPPPAPLLSVGRLDPAQERHLESLLKQFQDPDADRRRAAVVAIARTGDAAVPAIRARLNSTSNALVQRCALFALAEIGGEAAAVSARDALAASKLREDELGIAFLALGVLGPGAAFEEIASLANSRKPVFARRAAILALARANRFDLLEPAFGSVTRESLADVRVAMLVAGASSSDDAAIHAAIALLADRSEPVRRAACLVLAESGDSRGIDALATIAKNDRDERVLAGCALALGRIAGARALEILTPLLDHGVDEVRDAARAAVAARADGAASIVALLGRERDSARLARLAAACAASRSNTLDQPLQGLLTHARSEVRSAAGLALAARGSKGAEPALVAWLGAERDHGARADALLCCGALGLPTAKDTLRLVVTPPGREDLMSAVRRTLDGRRDARLLGAAVEARLRELRAREFDRRAAELEAAIAFVFDFEALSRFQPGNAKPPSGSGGDGGSGGGEGDGGSAGGNSLLKPKSDRKQGVVERDLETWFRARPYLEVRRPS